MEPIRWMERQLSRYRRLIKEIGKPTQNTWMAKPTTVILKENGALRAAESGNHDALHKKIYRHGVEST